MDIFYDKNGREIKQFDLLKFYHFTGPRRKKYYMYKWARLQGDKMWGLHLDTVGNGFWLKAVADKDGYIRDAEIVQGYGQDGDDDFENRTKNKKINKTLSK